jgi:acetyl-CoA carboxylase biotin carboxyl carrier protein
MPAKKPAAPKAVAKPAQPSELDLIRSLAGILNETGLTEIELSRQGIQVRVAKSMTVAASIAGPMPVTNAAPANIAIAEAKSAAESDATAAVKSPMVGTIYLAPSPTSANFIEVGQEVKQGQTLLIIEAMKTMNQIPSPKAGRVVRMLVGNGDPVEFGSPLVVIE